ncbi:uncharacterized protein LOC130701895 [Daphnia carinata]|uniref:uncharacterized protein LOC130701895 n=1 Tax=Daphnia carinata TaxID=120202 RepID=UPI002868ABD1|nr:uncharacterized protein LOC130701895 [Daphnia carinata]
MMPKPFITTSSILVLLFCASQTVNVVISHDPDANLLANESELTKQEPEAPADVNAPETTNENGETNVSPPVDVGGNILTAISVTSAVLTVLEAIDRRILPQPTTAEDILDGVRKLEDLIRPNDLGHYKKAEDSISRALHDMGVMMSGIGRQGPVEASQFQELLWLERARLIDGNIILLMEGLLGQQVAGSDLMENIQDGLKCDVMDVSEKVKRYNDLIESGSLAFNHFAILGKMSEQEISRRRAAFGQRNVRVLARNVQVVEQCFQRQLGEIRSESTTEQVAEQVAQVMSTLYPLPTRWIVAVYTGQQGMERGAIKPLKSKLSADFNVIINGFHVALFPFLSGKMPQMIDGRRIDHFCNRPVKAAGQMPTCDIGSTDGEYIYDELRRLGIVPDPLDLIVVPSEGQLSVRTVPLGSLPPFFAKQYPDFDIIVF